MKVMTLDRWTLMLNEREMSEWINTGLFRRLPEHDAADREYCELRDKMRANGDAHVYEAATPPSAPTPPHHVALVKSLELKAGSN